MADVPQLPTKAEPESAKMAFISNSLAIVGFIILFVIIVWGLLHIINFSNSSIGTFFTGSPSVAVTAPKSAVVGEPISVSWKYSGNESGTYSFLYQCQNGFAFATGAGGALATIPCGNAINVGSSTSATIVPVLTSAGAKSPIAASVTIVFASGTGSRTEGSAAIAISTSTPSSKVSTPSAPSENSPKPTTSSPSATIQPAAFSSASRAPAVAKKTVNLVAHAASGPADLSVRMILVGVIDPSSGALLPQLPLSPSQTVGVEFDVANIGGTATGPWYFTAQLPTGSQGYLYTSPAQRSLAPGEHIVNVLRFAPNMRPGLITITADPSGSVNDANRANNTETAQL